MERNSFFFKHLETIVIFLKGMLMGAADVVPGVSGGTIAFITGIYERLVGGIAFISEELSGFVRKPKMSKLYLLFKGMDWKLFVPLFLGIGSAILLFSGIISSLLVSSPGQLFSFFFGLILASAVVLLMHVRKKSWLLSLISLVSLVLTYFLVGLTSTAIPTNLITLFFAGMIAICAMILPGISGSYLLLVFGQYEVVINAVHNLDLLLLFVFGMGALFGLLMFSRVLKWLLRSYHDLMMFILVGVMLGALRVPATEVLASSVSVVFGVGFFVLGLAVVFLLQMFSKKKVRVE